MTLVLDDVAAALRFLAPPFDAIFQAEIAAALGDVMPILRRRGWRLCSYDAYAAWALAGMADNAQLLSLDKLLMAGSGAAQAAATLDVHRCWEGGTLVVAVPELPAFARDRPVLLVDDALYTGQTLARLLDKLSPGRNVRVRVGAAKLAAASRLPPGVMLEHFHAAAPGEDILHLRDLFPLLPFSGRRPRLEPGEVAVRIAPLLFEAGRWLALVDAPAIRCRLLGCTLATVDAIEQRIGRPLLAGDVARLGEGIAAPLTEAALRPDRATPVRALLGRDRG